MSKARDLADSAQEINILDGKSFLDEDNLASDSATGIASQQSIKAYVDATVTAQDLDFGTDDSTALTIDLDSEVLQFSGGTGISTSGSTNTVTFGIKNLTNTVQSRPIIASEEPFSDDFDASRIYAPVEQRRLFVKLAWTR